MSSLESVLKRLLLAVGMLTVVRVPVRPPVRPEDWRASVAFYPLAGLLAGAAPALVLLLPLPPLPRAALAVAAWAAVTGALHLDGVADCADAAFAPPRATREETRLRRLAILKDPHVGTFGVVALVVVLLAKTAALAEAPWTAPLVAAPLARWAMAWALRTYPPARTDGLGASLAGPGVPLATATALALLVLLPLTAVAAEPVRVAAAVVGGTLAAMVATDALARRFGGVTGDVCGAAGEVAETVALLGFLSWAA